jgi:type I restriction enzyme, S subunit
MSELIDTGIPWVGDIPADWNLKPLFSVANENKKKNKEKNENVLSLSYGKIIRRDLSKNFGLIPENFDGYQVVDNGYIIIRSTDLQNDKKSLRVGLVNDYGVITSAYIGLSPTDIIHPKFLFYYLNMCDLKKVFYSLGGGLRQSLRFEEFRRFPVVLSSIKEQQLISGYLDKKTEQIDVLIEKIQKKIELLKEQRTSLINQCVTKGLDPTVEMKDSGVEWIGKVPKRWEFKSTKFHFSYKKGTQGQMLTSTFLGENTGEFPVYSGQTHNNGVLGNWSEYEFDYPDGVIFVTTVGAKSMTSRLIRRKFSLSQNCLILIPRDDRVVPAFINYFFTYDFSYRKELLPRILQPSLRMEDLDQYKILLPSLPEQKQISDYLDQETSKIDKLVQRETEHIDLLMEYRQSLISSVVTGKVRVTEDMK